MDKTKKYFIFLFIFLFSLFFLLNKDAIFNSKKIHFLNNSIEIEQEKFNEDNKFKENNETIHEKNELIIALCPTFHYLFEKLEINRDINFIKTESTKESLKLIKNGSVNAIISGRALRENELNLFFKIIGKGYDFISKNEIIVFEEEMRFSKFYTDLEIEPIIESFNYISKENLTKIENINDYLEKGIVITFLNNRLVGEPVHILKKDGSRVNFSRLPRIYYLNGFPKDKIDFITKSL